jgi:H+/Cl- antiporter ClcA
MTPGMTIGALLSIVLAGGCSLAGFGVPNGACAIVGATAFLAASMKMPVTAIILAFELTHVGQDFLIPIMAAVAGSVATRELLILCSGASRSSPQVIYHRNSGFAEDEKPAAEFGTPQLVKSPRGAGTVS